MHGRGRFRLPGCSECGRTRCQLLSDKREIFISCAEVNHAGRFENRHVVIIRVREGEFLNGLDIVRAIINKKFGKDEAAQDMGKGL